MTSLRSLALFGVLLAISLLPKETIAEEQNSYIVSHEEPAAQRVMKMNLNFTAEFKQRVVLDHGTEGSITAEPQRHIDRNSRTKETHSFLVPLLCALINRSIGAKGPLSRCFPSSGPPGCRKCSPELLRRGCSAMGTSEQDKNKDFRKDRPNTFLVPFWGAQTGRVKGPARLASTNNS